MHTLRLVGSRMAPPAAAVALILLAAGCASDDQSAPPRGGKRPEAFIPLVGEQTFFQNTIKAEVRVGAMTGFDLGQPGAAPGAGRRGGGGGRHHHGGGGGGRPPGASPDGSGVPEGGGNEAEGGSPELRRAEAMGSPPVMIHLRLTNLGTNKTEVLIVDFSSALGDFVVRPDKLALDPGQALEVEPMSSRLAGQVASGEITLVLKRGQDREEKTVALEMKPEATPPPPPDKV